MRPPRIELDHAARPRPRRALGALVLGLSLVLAATLVLRHRDAALELERMEEVRGLAGAGRQPARAVPKARLDEEARAAEAVLRQLTLPWPEIVRTVEDAATQDVAILQLQPDALRRELRLAAEVRDREGMLEFLRRLTAAGALDGAHVVSHQVRVEDPQRPLQFSILALMRPAP